MNTLTEEMIEIRIENILKDGREIYLHNVCGDFDCKDCAWGEEFFFGKQGALSCRKNLKEKVLSVSRKKKLRKLLDN